MSVRERLEDARVLWLNGRKEGAFILILIAAAATSRKRYPKPSKGAKPVPETQRPLPGEYASDRNAFQTFILDEMGKIMGGPKYNVAFPFQGRDKVPLEEIFYKVLRCSMVHEGETPTTIVFTEPVLDNGKWHCVVRLNDPWRFPEMWFWSLAGAIIQAPENQPVFQGFDFNRSAQQGET